MKKFIILSLGIIFILTGCGAGATNTMSCTYKNTAGNITTNMKYDVDYQDKDVKKVRITNDLSYAKVYFTTLEDDKKKVENALNKASGFIRSCLCEKVQIRKMPEIHFVYDESIEYGKKIDDIIERINNEKQD